MASRFQSLLLRLLPVVGCVCCCFGCTPEQVDLVGIPCQSQDHCEELSEGFCTEGGNCSKPCSTHQECGCAEETSNDALEEGACWARCVAQGDGQGVLDGFCVRTCGEDADCEGLTTCVFGPYEAVGSCL